MPPKKRPSQYIYKSYIHWYGKTKYRALISQEKTHALWQLSMIWIFIRYFWKIFASLSAGSWQRVEGNLGQTRFKPADCIDVKPASKQKFTFTWLVKFYYTAMKHNENGNIVSHLLIATDFCGLIQSFFLNFITLANVNS